MLLLLLLSACADSDSGLPNLNGSWRGELAIPAVNIPLELELPAELPLAGGEAAGSMVVGDQRMVATISSAADSSIHFAAEQRGIYFTGRLPEPGHALTGMLVTGRQAYPVRLLPEAAPGGGSYTGSYRRPAEKQGIELKLSSNWLGRPTGYLLIPGRKRGAAIGNIGYRDRQLKLDCKRLALHFAGRYRSDRLDGAFYSQANDEQFPVTLIRHPGAGGQAFQPGDSCWITDISRGNRIFQSLLSLLDNAAYPELNSLLIAHKDTLLLERYFNAYTPSTLQDLSGITRGLTAMVAGHWIGDSLDVALQTFLPQIAAAHSKITIRHLLTMSSGLACNDWSATAVSNQEKLERQFNWPGHMMRLPLIEPPGGEWIECGGNAILLAGVLEHLSGKRFDLLVEEQLFKPLRITGMEWSCDSYANIDAGSGLRLQPRDLLKIGRLLLQQGRWEGRQLIPARWLTGLVSSQIALPPEARSRYGFYWWSRDMRLTDNEITIYYAAGSSGQFLMVVPGLDLTCVFTAGDYKGRHPGKAFEWLEQHILPAVAARQARFVADQ